MRSWRLPIAAVGLAVLALALPSSAGEPPPRAAEGTGIRAFSHHPKFVSVKISPKGKYLAALLVEDGKRSLVFIDVATRKLTSVVHPGGATMIGAFAWANDDRAVAELCDEGGDTEYPVSYGEIYSVDARSGHGKIVFGYRAGETPTWRRRPAATRAWGHIVSRLPNDEVLVSSRRVRGTSEATAR